MNLGISGRLTRATIQSPLTPLFLLAAIVVGLISTITIPREEEPQIKVPMVDIMVQAPGLSAPDAVELVAKPLETIVRSVDGVEHVYTQAQDHGVLVTARFLVGSNPEDAAIRINEKIEANKHLIPVGVPFPQVTVRGINDVPIVVLTLAPKPGAAGQWNDQALAELAGKLRTEIAKVDDVGLTFITGGQTMALRVVPDPARLALYDVPLSNVIEAVGQANRAFPAGTVREDGRTALVVAGQSLRDARELSQLTVRSVTGAPVLLSDVARVEREATRDQARAVRWTRDDKGDWTMAPAVSLAIAKRAGANAVVVAEQVVERVHLLQGTLIPQGVEVAVTRNYGETANEKANELILHLALATVSIVVLIGFAIGWREAGVTAIVIPTTIMLTMFASNLMGFTINRVSLFALIFSIGILVDDAIVMIENIARHWAMQDGAGGDARSRVDAAIEAVAEVGNPTVIATLTVVAALLPMLFVSGLMGPYMAPIPINASAAMIFSFFVAVIIAPWLMIRFARQTLANGGGGAHADDHGGRLGALYKRYASRVIATKRSAWRFLIAVGIATLLACSMFYFKAVTVKLLPFDNKSEVQLLVDLPEGTSLETTARVLQQAATITRSVPEVVSMEGYAGTSAPFNFNGLVRHYFLRSQPEMGDLMVALLPKGDRSRSSHEIAVVLREKLEAIPLPAGGSLKVVETPPGPPVLATLLAEIYGPDEATRMNTAEQVEKIFRSVPFIVDVDNSFGQPRPTLRLVPDRAKLDHYGLSERQLFDSIGTLLGSRTIGYASRNAGTHGSGRDPLPIVLELDQSQRTWSAALAATPVAVAQGPAGPTLVRLGELVTARTEPGGQTIFRRDGRGVNMVTAELAGRYEAPIYGMLAVDEAIEGFDWQAHGLQKPQVILHGQPDDESKPSLLWDGEWEITWVTFRDMGGAFMIALLGIYVLVVGQFRSFTIPLVILTPVPLTMVGIVLGHMLFRAPFTATSMIGFIALAGIIVRNSILLVDFIRHSRSPDKSLRQTLLEAGMIRFKPIVLTAAAAMIGAAVILTDPIFQGLAISLMFGLASSTLLTVLVIPAIYVVLRDDGRALESHEA
ncbi:multidrug transporter AcrB [Novosphingobium sp. PC22D]|uniref:efflux RND transporter permease subunit n=1 Tax=Novosphingobium sp. PC22D TaxID=1962403 RepID=UPI000BF0D0D3|nr:efflux RND transporter permease subunit [Novosphingobium sp. PC22D]PEQ13797.1 multidrug transporter AcrB [Novosphingobium sp. PC22D]